MSQSSPSRGGRRVDYGNGAYGYERADGSEYYNDGHGYVRYVHPDPSRSWEQFEGEERRYGPLDGKIENGDDGEEEGSEERFEGEEGEHVGGYGYSEDKGEREAYDYVQGEEDDDGDRFALGYRPESEDAEMPDAPPPPYTEYQSTPQQWPSSAGNNGPPAPRSRQTARRSNWRGWAARGNGTTRPVAGSGRGGSADPRTARGGGPRAGGTRGGGRERRGAKYEASPAVTARQSVASASKKAPVKKKCSQCSVSGHDARNCPLNKFGLGKKAKHEGKEETKAQAPPALPPPEKTESPAKKAVKKKCSQCQVTGHDARNCPLNQYGLGKKDGKGKAREKEKEKFSHETETTTTTTTTTKTKTSSSSKASGAKVLGGRVEKNAPKKKVAALKKK